MIKHLILGAVYLINQFISGAVFIKCSYIDFSIHFRFMEKHDSTVCMPYTNRSYKIPCCLTVLLVPSDTYTILMEEEITAAVEDRYWERSVEWSSHMYRRKI